jgi:hypothetical protein
MGMNLISQSPTPRGASAPACPRRTDRELTSLCREVLKLVIITAYIVFAIVLLVLETNPFGFIPLLPWALWSKRSP